MSHSLQVDDLGFNSWPVFSKGKHCEPCLLHLHSQPELTIDLPIHGSVDLFVKARHFRGWLQTLS